PGASLELKGLSFSGTRLAILQQSPSAPIPLTVSGSTFTNCDAPFRAQNGPLTIRDSAFTNNVGNVVGASDALTIERSHFDGPHGLAVFSFGADSKTTITDTTFTGNSDGALLVGAGSSNDLDQTVEIVRSTFVDNGRDAAGAKTARGSGAVSISCNTS